MNFEELFNFVTSDLKGSIKQDFYEALDKLAYDKKKIDAHYIKGKLEKEDQLKKTYDLFVI